MIYYGSSKLTVFSPPLPHRQELPHFTSLPGSAGATPSPAHSFSRVRCRSCAFYEEFARKNNGYWNKCALRDIYNVNPDSQGFCEYYTPRHGEEAGL